MASHPLLAISPIDGRYGGKVTSLQSYFSEAALIRYRVRVEVEYFIALCRIPLPQLASFDPEIFPKLQAIYTNFSLEDALEVKEIEKTTNHDVKAVEYYLKKKFDSLGLQAYKEFIHFGLTSQDINNTAIPLSLKEAMEEVYVPAYGDLHQTVPAKIPVYAASKTEINFRFGINASVNCFEISGGIVDPRADKINSGAGTYFPALADQKVRLRKNSGIV